MWSSPPSLPPMAQWFLRWWRWWVGQGTSTTRRSSSSPASPPFLLAAALKHAVRDKAAMTAEVGALKSIATSSVVLEERGCRVRVLVATCLAMKPHNIGAETTGPPSCQQGGASPPPTSPSPTTPKKIDPFADPENNEPFLFCGYVSASHGLVLNKFNVAPRHVIVYTREDSSQTSPVTLSDLHALYATLLSLGDGLGFFNCGAASGASQAHKHLQLIPVAEVSDDVTHSIDDQFPLIPLIRALPPPLALDSFGWTPIPRRLANITFDHAVCRVPAYSADDDVEGDSLIDFVTVCLAPAVEAVLALTGIDVTPEASLHTSYNLLFGRDWVMAVPRSQSEHGGVAINSVGFAGCVLVKSQEEVDVVRSIGPVTLLEHVGYPLIYDDSMEIAVLDDRDDSSMTGDTMVGSGLADMGVALHDGRVRRVAGIWNPRDCGDDSESNEWYCLCWSRWWMMKQQSRTDRVSTELQSVLAQVGVKRRRS